MAKKPYNPILGEIFRCCYYLGPVAHGARNPSTGSENEATEKPSGEHEADALGEFPEEEMSRRGPIPYASEDCVVFLAEQVHIALAYFIGHLIN